MEEGGKNNGKSGIWCTHELTNHSALRMLSQAALASGLFQYKNTYFYDEFREKKLKCVM